MKLKDFLFEDHNNVQERNAVDMIQDCIENCKSSLELIKSGEYQSPVKQLKQCQKDLKKAVTELEKHIKDIKKGKTKIGPVGGGENLV